MLNLIFPQIIFILSCLISISCNAQPDNISFGHLKRIQIKGDEQDNIAALVGEHRYIKLETRAECLISSIDKISYKSGKFFILDLKEQNLFIFNKEGKFITKIGRLGRGPGEYTHLMDFDVDRLGNIYLLDLHQKAILKFNKDGEFLEKDQKNYYICNIAVIDTSTLLTYQAAKVSPEITHKLVFIKNGKKLKSFLPLHKETNRISMTKPFSLTQSEGKFLYNGDLSDTIFSVSQKTLYAEYFLDFGEYAMSPESRSGLDNDYSTFSVEKFNEGRRIINCFETSNFFTCTYNLKGRTWSLYYSLKERKPFVSYCPDCDEMAQKVINNFKAIGVWDDYFISYLDFDTIDRYKKDINAKPSRMREIISSDNINFINSIDLSDNPVLVLYKMR